MNLSPEWTGVLQAEGWDAVHWSSIGKPNAPDIEIFAYARNNGYTVFTHDLDFGSILASTNAKSPSVIQIRVQNITPEYLSEFVVAAIRQFTTQLENGALITINKNKLRAKILPLK